MNPGQHREFVERNSAHLLVHGWRFVHSRRHKALCLWNDALQHGFAMRVGPAADDPLGQRVGQLVAIEPPTDWSGAPVTAEQVPAEFFPALEQMGFTLL